MDDDQLARAAPEATGAALKIGLGMPTGEMVHAGFALCLGPLMVKTALTIGVVPEQLNLRSCYVQQSRYQLARDAIEMGCTHVLYIDSDMTFPADGLLRLLAHEKPVVGGIYLTRRQPHYLLGVPADPGTVMTSGIMPMRRLPGGFLLVETAVFERLPKPWFNVLYLEALDDWLGEDYFFSDACWKAGIEMWADLDLSHELVHIGQQGAKWSGAAKPSMPTGEIVDRSKVA